MLDGRVVAVEPSSGAVLWTFDSGSPLVSVVQNGAVPGGLNIFPGVDGGLYAYSADDPQPDAGDGDTGAPSGADGAKLQVWLRCSQQVHC